MADYQGVALIIATATTSIATLAGVWATVHRTRREESIKLRITVMEDVNILNSPLHDEDKKYTTVSVVNVGQVPVNITKVGEVYYRRTGGGIFSDSMIGGAKSLKYDDGHDFVAEDTDRPDAAYYYVQIRNGKTFKKYVRPRLFVWIVNFLHKTKLKKKKVVS